LRPVGPGGGRDHVADVVNGDNMRPSAAEVVAAAGHDVLDFGEVQVPAIDHRDAVSRAEVDGAARIRRRPRGAWQAVVLECDGPELPCGRVDPDRAPDVDDAVAAARRLEGEPELTGRPTRIAIERETVRGGERRVEQ